MCKSRRLAIPPFRCIQVAAKLREAINYQTQVTWNEASQTLTDPPWLVVVKDIFVGTLAFCGHHANRYADAITRVAVQLTVQAGFAWRGTAQPS